MIFENLLGTVLPIKRPSGPCRKRSATKDAGNVYDYLSRRRVLAIGHFRAPRARKGIECSDRLGRHH